MTTKTEKRRRQKAKVAIAIDRIANDDQVNPYARQHGDYVREGNKASINRGGTPVARWRSAVPPLLSETQLAAIELCWRLWDRAGRESGLVQDLLKVVGQPAPSGWSQQDALDHLARIKEYVPGPYFGVFENVCRFDEPAGVAGSKLATNRRSAIDAARICVCFVADIIHQRERL